MPIHLPPAKAAVPLPHFSQLLHSYRHGYGRSIQESQANVPNNSRLPQTRQLPFRNVKDLVKGVSPTSTYSPLISTRGSPLVSNSSAVTSVDLKISRSRVFGVFPQVRQITDKWRAPG
jgi:hypothetical protein